MQFLTYSCWEPGPFSCWHHGSHKSFCCCRPFIWNQFPLCHIHLKLASFYCCTLRIILTYKVYRLQFLLCPIKIIVHIQETIVQDHKTKQALEPLFISGSVQKMHYQVSYQDTRQNLLKQRTDHQRTRMCSWEQTENVYPELRKYYIENWSGTSHYPVFQNYIENDHQHITATHGSQLQACMNWHTK
jgi:hypothetical protein